MEISFYNLSKISLLLTLVSSFSILFAVSINKTNKRNNVDYNSAFNISSNIKSAMLQRILHKYLVRWDLSDLNFERVSIIFLFCSNKYTKDYSIEISRILAGRIRKVF